jgi:hypothetical protein
VDGSRSGSSLRWRAEDVFGRSRGSGIRALSGHVAGIMTRLLRSEGKPDAWHALIGASRSSRCKAGNAIVGATASSSSSTSTSRGSSRHPSRMWTMTAPGLLPTDRPPKRTPRCGVPELTLSALERKFLKTRTHVPLMVKGMRAIAARPMRDMGGRVAKVPSHRKCA